MPEANPPSGKDDDGALLRDAVKLLTEEVRLQRELMSLQNAQLSECRQQLEARAEELHRARQEAILHHGLFEREAFERRRLLNTRFWRYSAPVRRLLGLFASPRS